MVECNSLTGKLYGKENLTGDLNNPVKDELVPTVSIVVGKVEGGDIAKVENVGTPQNAIFDFILPRGPSGEAGVDSITNTDIENILDKFIGG